MGALEWLHSIGTRKADRLKEAQAAYTNAVNFQAKHSQAEDNYHVIPEKTPSSAAEAVATAWEQVRRLGGRVE